MLLLTQHTQKVAHRTNEVRNFQIMAFPYLGRKKAPYDDGAKERALILLVGDNWPSGRESLLNLNRAEIGLYSIVRQ